MSDCNQLQTKFDVAMSRRARHLAAGMRDVESMLEVAVEQIDKGLTIGHKGALAYIEDARSTIKRVLDDNYATAPRRRVEAFPGEAEIHKAIAPVLSPKLQGIVMGAIRARMIPLFAAAGAELDHEYLAFYWAVCQGNGMKYPAENHHHSNGDPLWARLEALGLIRCIGSWRWEAIDPVAAQRAFFLAHGLVLPEPTKSNKDGKDD